VATTSPPAGDATNAPTSNGAGPTTPQPPIGSPTDLPTPAPVVVVAHTPMPLPGVSTSVATTTIAQPIVQPSSAAVLTLSTAMAVTAVVFV
jgi:hypothetical protein